MKNLNLMLKYFGIIVAVVFIFLVGYTIGKVDGIRSEYHKPPVIMWRDTCINYKK